MPNNVIKEYLNISLLAKRSFGMVYQADCSTTGITKTIKVIKDVKDHGRASAEVELLKRCRHPNVIALENIIKSRRGGMRLVFPVYDMDVRQFINRRRGVDPEAYPEEHKVQIASGLWHGLKYLHSLSIVHRDIKPANILITFMATMIVVIADLGLAADTTSPSTSAGAQLTAHVCTDGYAAPELLAVRKVEDAASYDLSVDVWSAAVVTYEVVSLVRFIAGINTGDIHQLASCIASRLGEVLHRNACQWQHDIAEPWQSLIALGLKWRAGERSSAECVAGSLAARRNKSSVAETGTA